MLNFRAIVVLAGISIFCWQVPVSAGVIYEFTGMTATGLPPPWDSPHAQGLSVEVPAFFTAEGSTPIFGGYGSIALSSAL
jgi:hypothetical protein